MSGLKIIIPPNYNPIKKGKTLEQLAIRDDTAELYKPNKEELQKLKEVFPNFDSEDSGVRYIRTSSNKLYTYMIEDIGMSLCFIDMENKKFKWVGWYT